MTVKTAEIESIRPYLKEFVLPAKRSHKGQNGKVLVIGGSELFHSASLWAAEVASFFADMVFYSSIAENNEVMRKEAKHKFKNGIIVKRSDLKHYVQEADSILIGPGMVRGNLDKGEASITYTITKELLTTYPQKKFILDAGALQMMEKNWLTGLKTPPILTPHQGEYRGLFGDLPVKEAAARHNCVILKKAIEDTVSDGSREIIVIGGNQGLTKGGTGDVLAGLTLAFSAKNEAVLASVLASFLLKKSAEDLFLRSGYWYNIDTLIGQIPQTLNRLLAI